MYQSCMQVTPSLILAGTGTLSQGVKPWGVKLTTHMYLKSRMGKRGAVTSIPINLQVLHTVNLSFTCPLSMNVT